MSEPNDHGARDRPHVAIDAFREVAAYRVPSRDMKRKPLRDDYAAHAASLLDQIGAAMPAVPRPEDDNRIEIGGMRRGAVVAVETRAPDEGSQSKAAKISANFDFVSQDIVVLRSERNGDRSESALVFVPDASRDFLKGRITAYGRDPNGGVRPDADRFELVERVGSVSPRALFVGVVDFADWRPTWWELWIRETGGRADHVAAAARRAEIDVHGDRLHFPDTTVVFLHGSAAAIESFVARVPGAVTEVRRATGTVEPFLEEGRLGIVGQADWVADLAARVTRPDARAPVVCTLDTGVAAAHPLLEPGLHGAWCYDEAWGAGDHAPHGGHGTALATTVLYGDLAPLMADLRDVVLGHATESMKLLPPPGAPATAPPSYGIVTQGAVASVEVERPGVLRSFCLASSTDVLPPERPSSWSGAIDQIAAGSMLGDVGEGVPAAETPKRLVIAPTGNVTGGMLADVMPLKPLEDPSQSWNALTIGGITTKDLHSDGPPRLTPIVAANNRSPFSRGSDAMPNDLTPIKPEVLFEAGNMLADPGGFCGWHPAVSLLSAGSDVVAEPLVPFWATSAAAGMAGNFVGRLQAALPNLWPETHRALTVDSAQWPQPIRKLLVGRGAHWKTAKKAAAATRQRILREVGYGVPDIERAIMSARNDLTLVAQAEIQPFVAAQDGRSAVFNEMHFYDLPWPRAALERLENEIVTMKVTLSYFVEPNLSGRAATRPDTYRSFGLRFNMKRRTETDAQFRSRVSAAQARDAGETTGETSRWLLGPQAVQAGSLHCDLWRGRAVELAGHDAIAVVPVGGWWKSHIGQRRMNDRARYSLVISISAAGQAVDLHSEVRALVDAAQVAATV